MINPPSNLECYIYMVLVICIITIILRLPKWEEKPGGTQTAPPPPAPIPQHDSISLQEQLMRLNAEHAHWTNVFFSCLEKMKQTASMDDYVIYQRDCHNAGTRVKRLDDQITYLKRALSDVRRAVGNYPPERITTPSTIFQTKKS
jgi:hypothetical protein